MIQTVLKPYYFSGEIRGRFKERNQEITTAARPNKIMAQLARNQRQVCLVRTQKASRNGKD